MISCTSTKGVAGAAKPSKKDLKGTWQVTNIRFVGEAGLYKADLFDSADSACFKGSEWVFIPNNNTGKFTLSKSNNCDAISQRILWSFFDAGDGSYDFQFKFVDAKNKPLADKKSGYRLKISNLSTSTMETRVQTTNNGEAFDVVLTFEKTSENFTL